MKETIKKLTECFGPSGHETAVREAILAELPRGLETRVDESHAGTATARR